MHPQPVALDGLLVVLPVTRPVRLDWLGALSPLARILVVDDGVGVERAALPRQVILLRNAVPLGVGRCCKQAINHALLYLPQLAGLVLVSDGEEMTGQALEKLCAALDEHPLSLTVGYTPPATPPGRGVRFAHFASRVAYRVFNGHMLRDVQAPVRLIPREIWPTMLEVPGEGEDYLLGQLMSPGKSLIPIQEVSLPGRPVPRPLSLRLWISLCSMLWRYLGVSSTSILVNYVVFLLLYYILIPSIPLCTVLAQAASLVVSYIAARRLVFGSASGGWQLVRYFALTLSLMVINILLISYLSNILGIPVLFAKPISEVLVYSGSFFLQREIVFRAPKRMGSP